MPFGRLTLGLRENARRLKFLGYNVHLLGTLVFAIAAMFSGIAGALQAINIEAANYLVFDAGISTVVVLNSFIGGVKIFLGPAIGAAFMTFFGHVSSDLTRSWLLYQGIIFVLVMMYLPNGIVHSLARFADDPGSLRATFGTLLAKLSGIVVTGAGVVMMVELLQRFFSSDYKAQVRDGVWPTVELFGWNWAPWSLTTWIIPLGLLAAGIVILFVTGRRAAAVNDGVPA